MKARDVGKMTHQDLAPDKWKDLIQEKKEKDENRYAPKLEANTDNYTCRKCKVRNVLIISFKRDLLMSQ